MTKRKTVLAFIDWYRPGYKAGGTITAFGNFVDYLEDDINFKIVTRNNDYSDHEDYKNNSPNTWTPFGKGECYYLSQSELSIKAIKHIISTTDYDFLYVNGIFSFYFSILPIVLSKGKQAVINPHGMLSSQAFSVKPLKKHLFLAVFNTLKMYKHSTFHVANSEEAVMVKEKVATFKAVKIANQFPRKLSNVSIKDSHLSKPIRLVNVARISIEKGTLKMIESLKNVQQELVLDIFGPIYNSDYWGKCQVAINHLPEHITVNYSGFIESRFVLDTLKEYDFFILFSEGENFGHSILEALSVGCPVIISNKTPWRDLESKGIGWDVDLKNSNAVAEVFSKILKINQEEYRELANQAFIFAKNFSENKALIDQNKNIFL